MALNQKALQQKRSKKSQQRKETKRKPGVGLGEIWSFAREWAAAAHAPIADVFVPRSLFEQGMGNIWFSRHLADGRYAITAFLVDSYCLGVKDALHAIVEPESYARHLRKYQEAYPDHQREHPAYARKLVEAAAAYARELGFDPHPDYKLARLIFGDVDANTCPAGFTFGREGRPFFFSGPNDTPKEQKRILHTLEKRLGAGGFDYLLGMESIDGFE